MSKVYVGVFDNVTRRSFWLYQDKDGRSNMDVLVFTPFGFCTTALVLEDGAMRRKVLLWNGKVGWVTRGHGWSWSEHETST